jgi:hypothetical protein
MCAISISPACAAARAQLHDGFGGPTGAGRKLNDWVPHGVVAASKPALACHYSRAGTGTIAPNKPSVSLLGPAVK